MINVGKKIFVDLISSVADPKRLMKVLKDKQIPENIRNMARKELDRRFPRYRREYMEHLSYE